MLHKYGFLKIRFQYIFQNAKNYHYVLFWHCQLPAEEIIQIEIIEIQMNILP